MVIDGWENVARVLLMGVSAYVALILFLRLSGSRTLAKLSAFDLVVTVALGSTLATILLNRDVTLVEGVTAFATLILLQFAIAKLSVCTRVVERLVRSQAQVLVGRTSPSAQGLERFQVLHTQEEPLLSIASGRKRLPRPLLLVGFTRRQLQPHPQPVGLQIPRSTRLVHLQQLPLLSVQAPPIIQILSSTI